MSTHLFIDLEALGQKPGCAPIELGAVVFDPQTGVITDEFHRIIKPHAALKGERDTLDWHAERGSYPFTPARYIEAEHLHHAIADFFAWLPAEYESVWSWGSTYDFPVLDHALAVIGQKAPWEYWQQQCARTAWKIAFGPDRKHAPRPHHALEDCRAGVADLCEALRYTKGDGTWIAAPTYHEEIGELRERLQSLFGSHQRIEQQLTAALLALVQISSACPGGEIGDPEADQILSRIYDLAEGALVLVRKIGSGPDRIEDIANASLEGFSGMTPGESYYDFADYLARAIFAFGDEDGDRVQRIAFKGGEYPDKETDLGGLNLNALRHRIEDAIKRPRPANTCDGLTGKEGA